MLKNKQHKICVAPMMGYTDTHMRFMLRMLSKNAFLYTEMIHVNAIIKNYKKIFVKEDLQHKIALQIGGDNIKNCTEAAIIGEDFGFDEINLNIGCPSPRVIKGGFGVILMLNAKKVGTIVKSITNKINIPLSIKTRIGVDDFVDYNFLKNFICINADAGCKIFIIHARIAKLKGFFSTKKNRQVPALNYKQVYRLKKDFPNLEIIINGGINNLTSIKENLKFVDGCMLGRVIQKNPFFLNFIEQELFNNYAIPNSKNAKDILLKKLIKYALTTTKNAPNSKMLKSFINLYYQEPNKKQITSLLNQVMQKNLPLTDLLNSNLANNL